MTLNTTLSLLLPLGLCFSGSCAWTSSSFPRSQIRRRPAASSLKAFKNPFTSLAEERVQQAPVGSRVAATKDSSSTDYASNQKQFFPWFQSNNGDSRQDSSGMGDLVPMLGSKSAPSTPSTTDSDSSSNGQTLLTGAAALLLAGSAAFAHYQLGWTVSDVIAAGERLVQNPQETLQEVINGVQAMGPIGALYFGLVYLIAEILAVPATPLTLSAGYLFGLTQGTAVVLVAATLAASFSFVIGKTFLRGWVEETLLAENPKFRKLDQAIAQEGFPLLFLVRLSPLFPFALSNYLYGASAIGFADYFWGTLLGFAPGTIAYVYTGMVGQALTVGGGDGTQPWYVYAGVFTFLAAFLKVVSDMAARIVDEIDDEGSMMNRG